MIEHIFFMKIVFEDITQGNINTGRHKSEEIGGLYSLCIEHLLLKKTFIKTCILLK